MKRPVTYFDEVLQDVGRDNSLVILGRGLGMTEALSSFVSASVEPGKLLIGINITRICALELIWPAITSSLDHSLPSRASLLLPRFINTDYSIKDRKQVYELGGFLIITSNVLVHDFLHSNIPVEQIAGLVIFSADDVREGSNDHFAVKLFRMHNRSGFIKAFSESPDRIANNDFHNLEKVMSRLYLSRACLWPRFHRAIKSYLGEHVPDLIDLSVQLPSKMSLLLNSLRQIAMAILEDLRSSTKLIDISDVYFEDSTKCRFLKPFFDLVIRNQIEGPSNTVGWRVRSLINDLGSIRRLIRDVFHLSSVQFYHKLVTLRQSSPNSSNWLIRKESQSALLVARSRVWCTKLGPKDPESDNATVNPVEHGTSSPENKDGKRKSSHASKKKNENKQSYAIPTLELLPKWAALSSALKEIHEDVTSAGPNANLGRVLVFVREKRLVEELQTVLCDGAESYIERQFKDFFPNTANRVARDAELIAKNDEKFRQVTLTQLNRKDAPQELPKRSPEGDEDVAAPASFVSKPRKRARFTKFPGGQVEASDMFENAKLSDFRVVSNVKNRCEKQVETLIWHCGRIDYQGRARRVMNEFRPSFIILFNPDVSLVRQTELYKASHPRFPVRLYILTHADYTEENQFGDYVKKEKNSFKSLIRERASMAQKGDQEGRLGSEEKEFLTQTLGVNKNWGVISSSRRNTRQMNTTPKANRQIIVDTRELRSKLPMMLHKEEVKIISVTLEVGDFILSKRIGVERKTIPDLYQSFNSGRLFSQAEALCTHYQVPCLLIEMGENAMLSLASTNGGVRSELSISSIISKMVLLVQHFGGLRILWARGAHDAVKLFLLAKEKEEEPDEKVAMSIGLDTAHARENSYNLAPQALARSLPGIDGENIHRVMRGVKNVAALMQLSHEEMKDILGSAEKATKLYEFANQEATDELSTL